MNLTRIFCAFPVFAPSEKLFQKNMESIISFINYLKIHPFYLDGSKGHILDIYFGGWTSKDSYWDEIKKTIKDAIPNAKTFRFDKNYGKAKVVNNLAKDYFIDNPNTEFMFTIDSDMRFLVDQPYMFDRLLLAASALQTNLKRPFGFVALDQQGENCHWYEPRGGYTGMNQFLSYTLDGSGMKIEEKLVWPSDGAGIAGGSLFINSKIWRQIGGYRNFNTEYAGEDGLYLRDVQQAGASVCIIKTLSILHPIPEDDPEYRAWKNECMKSAFEPFDQDKYMKNVNSSKDWVEIE